MSVATPSYTEMSKGDLIGIIESQKRTVNALQNETRWLTGVIFNPAYNEVDIRLLVQVTPRELRMGYSYEAQEKKVYLPDLARKVHSSTATVPKRIKRLEDAGLFHYRSAKDPETGNTRAFLETRPTLALADETKFEEAQRGGGSTWQDGKRMKRCKDCGSEHLVEVTKKEIICNDCGSQQGPLKETRRALNATDTPYSHRDGESPEKEEETPYHHGDAEESGEETHYHSDGECTRSGDPDATPTTDSVDSTIDHHGDGECTELERKKAWARLQAANLHRAPELVPGLAARRIWYCWRYEYDKDGKVTKMPYIADLLGARRASSTDMVTWRTYDYAIACYDQSQSRTSPFDGIGFMCDGTFTFLDHDHCRNRETGEIEPEAMERARMINTYTEPSISGDGIHSYAWETLPNHDSRKCSSIGVEIYDHARPCVFTGNPLPDFPQTMESRQEEIAAVYHALPARKCQKGEVPAGGTCDASVDEIWFRAATARNGAKFQKLWSGDASDYPHADGTPDHSAADQALCNLLAYWTSGDASAIDRAFRQSGLMREKWEREDYRTNTINCALASLRSRNEEVASC